MDKRNVYIYGLCTASDDTIMYVGKTVKKLKTRLKSHINESKRLNSSKKHKWINGAILKGDEILIKELECCNALNWYKKEIHYIGLYKDLNENITNSTSGGESGGFVCLYTYTETKLFAIEHKVKTKNEWCDLIKKKCPYGMPKCPRNYYTEFKSWGDFLGTGRIQSGKKAKIYINYKSAKEWVSKNLNIKTKTQWESLDKENILPDFIPISPNCSYKNKGWVGWGDFLDNGRIARHLINYVSYDECKHFPKKHNIKNKQEWFEFVKNENGIPINIPKDPRRVYNRNGTWVSWGDFLDNGRIARHLINYVSYDECKHFPKKHNIKTRQDWRDFIKINELPMEIPRTPSQFYKKDNTWVSWYDFLGKE